MAIEFYKEFGELGYLANYSDHGFYDDGVFYKTVEHYYQANKFDNPDIRKKIIECDTPKEASNIGRDVNNIRRDHFDKIKLDVMEKGVYLKFKNHSDLRSKLIETGNEDIVEMSVKESFWGIGPNLDGENHIGKILVKVRERLKKELKDKIIDSCSDKQVYVLGHRKPDTDSLVSSLILTNILKSRGVDAVFAVRDEDLVDLELFRDYFKDKYTVCNDYSDKYFILVDHNNLDGIDKDKTLGSIDHHRIIGEVEDLIEIEYASCSLLLYDLFRDEYQFSDYEKELIFLATCLDTDFLCSKRLRDYDKELLSTLGNYDIDSIRDKYLKLTNFDLDVTTNLFEDYKEYTYNGVHIRRCIIKSNKADKDKYINLYLIKVLETVDLIIWCTYDEKKSYICYKGEIIEFPFFTTSTNLVLDYLEKNNIL